jgi:hypothetical protein
MIHRTTSGLSPSDKIGSIYLIAWEEEKPDPRVEMQHHGYYVLYVVAT